MSGIYTYNGANVFSEAYLNWNTIAAHATYASVLSAVDNDDAIGTIFSQMQVRIYSEYGGEAYEIDIYGSDLTLSGNMVTGGTVDNIQIERRIARYEWGDFYLSELFLENISLDGARLSAAAATTSDDDDEAIWDAVLAGDSLMRLNGTVGNKFNGLDGSDLMRGGQGRDILRGGAGNDTIDAREGNDILFLESGNDSQTGGAGIDLLIGYGTTDYRVDLDVAGAQNTGRGLDTLLEIENVMGGFGNDTFLGTEGANMLRGNGGSDRLIGRGGDDVLLGGASRDALFGGAGNDTLNGQAGMDTLTGGRGMDVMSGGDDTLRDVFVFSNLADSVTGGSRDVITDFDGAHDLVDLSALDANVRLSGDQAFDWGGQTTTAYGVWYVVWGGDAVLRADVNGDGRADFTLRFEGVSTLEADMFDL